MELNSVSQVTKAKLRNIYNELNKIQKLNIMNYSL